MSLDTQVTNSDKAAKEGHVAQVSLPAKLEWPTIRSSIAWWVKAYAFSIAAIGLPARLFNQLASHPWLILFAVTLAPISYVVIEYLATSIAIAYRRYRSYETLYDLISKGAEGQALLEQRLLETEAVVQYLSQKLVVSQKIEIEKVQLFNGNISLMLKPRKTHKLQIGVQLKVIDLTEGMVMGTFQVTQTEPNCLARAVDINPIWSGYIHEAGPESSAPPNSAAILLEGDQSA